MIGQITRITVVLLIVGFLPSCATKPQQTVQSDERLNEIQDIRITEGKSNTAIEEVPEGSGKTSTVFLKEPLEDPDVPHALSGRESVAVEEELPAVLLRSEEPVDEQETSVEATVVEEQVPVVEAPIVEEQILPIAKWVTSIQFMEDEDLRLLITSDGILSPSIFRVDKKRIAIDLPGVKLALNQTKVLANNPLVKQVRIGNHAKKLRLVVDLSSDVSYTWQQNRDELEVTFRDPSVPVKQVEQKSVKAVVPEVIKPTPLRPSIENNALSALPPPLVFDTEKMVTGAQGQNADALSEGKGALVEAELQPENKTEENRNKPSRKKTFLRQRQEKKTEQSRNLFVQKRKSGAALPDPPKPKYSGKKISLDFQDAEITNVIRLVADVSQLNFVMGEDVKGKVSLKLSNVPWDQALDIILEMNSLGKVQEGNIIRITTLANLANQRDEMVRAKETEVNSADLVTRVIYVNYGKAGEAEKLLEKLLSPRGEIMVDKRTNAMIVKDVEENLEQIERLAQKLDTKTPQVLIEARIAEVKPSFKKSLGVQWGADLKTTQGGNILGVGNAASGSAFNSPTPDFAVNLPASDNLGGIGFTFGRFTQSPFTLDLRLSAGEVQETTRIVSTPKIMVLDNHEALIEQGESIPFQTSSGNEGTKTQFIDANLTLKVTPHISPDGGILLDVLLTKNEPALITEAGAPGPRIFKKEVTTKILLMDGETVVIGGIYESKSSETESGLPWFKDLPILGWLFKSESSSKSITELLVFITPTIMS